MASFYRGTSESPAEGAHPDAPPGACAICGAESRIIIQRRGRDLRRCVVCGFSWVPQGVMRHDDGLTIYEHDPPIFVTDGNTDYYLDDSAFDNARTKVAWVAEHVPTGAMLLDIGANFGHFLREAASRYRVIGIEPSPIAVSWACRKLGVPIEVGSIHDTRPDLEGRFDAITMFDVIEHVADPRGALERARRLLAPHGRLFVTTPDAASLAARVFGKRWYHYDLVQHVSLFNRRNLSRLLEEVGFTVMAFRTFGRIYRISYVRERLGYLAKSSLVWRAAHAATSPLSVMADRRVSINLGDVLGIVAEARA